MRRVQRRSERPIVKERPKTEAARLKKRPHRRAAANRRELEGGSFESCIDTNVRFSKRAMELTQLAKASLTKPYVSMLLGLHAPESSKLRGSTNQIASALDNLFALWVQLLVNKAEIPLHRYEYLCPHGHRHSFEGEDVRGRLLLSLAGYFDVLARRYLAPRSARPNAPFLKALVIAEFSRLIPDEAGHSGDPRRTQFRILSCHYFYALSSLYITSVLRSAHAPRPAYSELESCAHRALNSLVRDSFDVIGQNERIAASRLAQGALAFAQQVYDDIPKWNSKHQLGPFSAIHIDELALLARRDRSLLKRYGTRNAERVFEKQLALIMQSFGLFVVSTRVGQSTVDLVCISPSAEERFTFLVEAKTTSSAYFLPKKDGRALKEYVAGVRASLSTLPPLGFVLIIGHAGSKTLVEKLARLQSEIAIPVRFVRAQQIADLRERIPGPLPLKAFASEVLRGATALANDFVNRVVGSYDAEQSAHRDFVERMLAARGVVPRNESWPGDSPH